MAESKVSLAESFPARMRCYTPCDKLAESNPFSYNPELNAGTAYTSEYQGPDYKIGGVQVSDSFSVFMGVNPTTEAAEFFARNGPRSFSLKWAENTEALLRDKLLGCNASKWTAESCTVMGKRYEVHMSEFNVPQGSIPMGDLKNWEFGPSTEPLYVDFSNGINGEFGMMTVGNNKHGGVPDIHRSNWNDNVQVVWDEKLRKYVCQLDTYLVYSRISGIRKAWTIKNTGGLITTRMYASGRFEVRAKVPKVPGLVWAIWTFWGNELHSHQQVKGSMSSKDTIPICNSPMWVNHETECGHLFSQPGKQFPNHEIDIEIPSNSPQTISTKNNSNKYATMNMNCYRWTNADGTGAYNNLFCHSKDGPFVGDGKYHTYRFDWHTGNEDTAPVVDFYFDDKYVGTNDAFVPYMAGRLWIMFVAPPNGQPGGNGAWNGVIDQTFSPHASKLGDVALYARVLVDYVRITPFKESICSIGIRPAMHGISARMC